MPVYWTIDSKERLFTAIAEGNVSFDDAMALLEAISGAGAVAYRKLIDGRGSRSTRRKARRRLLGALAARERCQLLVRADERQGAPGRRVSAAAGAQDTARGAAAAR